MTHTLCKRVKNKLQKPLSTERNKRKRYRKKLASIKPRRTSKQRKESRQSSRGTTGTENSNE